jgi:uncharacterized membrane protein
VGRVRQSVDVPAPAGAAETLWLDTDRWPSFIDGFGHVARRTEDWPAPGASVMWDSPPGGRGRVLETVTLRDPGLAVTTTFEDQRVKGEQRASFTPVDGGGTRVVVEVDYDVKPGSGVPKVVDFLFVRRAMSDALRRTLTRYRAEAGDLY